MRNIPYYFILSFLFSPFLSANALQQPGDNVFYGISDVSAAVFLDPGHFVVADDESNFLRIYDRRNTAGPVSRLDLTNFLNADSGHPEADIEAAAQVGDRIYWITSHGRNKDGKERPSRRRFFCTRLVTTPEGPRLVPEGRAIPDLMHRFFAQASPVARTLDQAARFDESLSKKERQKLAPKENGLNIEGLAYYQPTQSLLIGLRNPLVSPDGGTGDHALVIELLNPREVIAGGDPRFGRTLLWDLGKRGIRGMQYCHRQQAFFILAGSIDSETTFALYRWDGRFEHQPELFSIWPKTDTFNPEAMAPGILDGRLWIFSDDGALEIPVRSPSECQAGELLENGTCPNKYLADPNRKTFRVRILNPVDSGQ